MKSQASLQFSETSVLSHQSAGLPSFGILSTYPPTRCGLATFSAALSRGLAVNGADVSVVRVADGSSTSDARVVGELTNGSASSAAAAVDLLSQSDVAVIQHEYGIYGGPDGDEVVDIIGALPKRDERDYGRGDEAFDIIMETAKSRNKMVHVHVDQFNESLEYETEQLCEKTIQHGMQGKVVAIHGISIAAHSRAYRQRLYTLMREADVMMIACPTAWIDTPRSEQIGPMHNSMTPVDELVPAGITVALGTDNVCDAMVPWNAGDMWHEMTTLATGCRFDYFDELVKIATVNGRKAIGID